ncbi:hypothetical protein [Streptosporangium roseum]|uniref:hypothetical protein n=1 Tax=Streptosporangium roseum TaxID=2001 RepID=UPI0001A3F00A|nr:hypothetical protein [Streptosporangium roseum]
MLGANLRFTAIMVAGSIAGALLGGLLLGVIPALVLIPGLALILLISSVVVAHTSIPAKVAASTGTAQVKAGRSR